MKGLGRTDRAVNRKTGELIGGQRKEGDTQGVHLGRLSIHKKGPSDAKRKKKVFTLPKSKTSGSLPSSDGKTRGEKAKVEIALKEKYGV